MSKRKHHVSVSEHARVLHDDELDAVTGATSAAALHDRTSSIQISATENMLANDTRTDSGSQIFRGTYRNGQ